jgi:hypothetical protein
MALRDFITLFAVSLRELGEKTYPEVKRGKS